MIAAHVRLQPRRAGIATAAVGWKSMLATFKFAP